MNSCPEQTIVIMIQQEYHIVLFFLLLKEISQNAVFVEGTTGTTDICQGQLGESSRKTSKHTHPRLLPQHIRLTTAASYSMSTWS